MCVAIDCGVACVEVWRKEHKEVALVRWVEKVCDRTGQIEVNLQFD